MNYNSLKLLQIEFEPVSLQTQIPLNVQTKVQFKISRIRNRSNSQNTKKKIMLVIDVLKNLLLNKIKFV